MRRTRRLLLPALIALLPSAYLAWRLREMPHLGRQHDDSVYFVTARSLAERGEYRIENLPGRPAQAKYPPLYPLYLSLVWKLAPEFPGNLPIATLFGWLTLPAFVAAAHLVCRDLGLSAGQATAVSVVAALSGKAIQLSVMLRPELLFSAAVLVSLWTAGREQARFAAAAGILGGLAFLVKTAALPLLVTTPLWYLVRRQPRRAALFAVSMAPFVAGWFVWAGTHRAAAADLATLYATDYLGYYRHTMTWELLPRVLWQNLVGLLAGLGSLVAPRWSPSLAIWAVGGLAGAVAVIGHARKTGLRPYHLFAAGLAPLLLPWNYPVDDRFVLPLYPLLLAGVLSWLSRISPGVRLPALAALGIPALFANGAAIAQLRPWLLEGVQIREPYGWIARNTPADAVLLAQHDAVLWLATGRRAVRYPVSPATSFAAKRESMLRPALELDRTAQQLGARYVVVTARDFEFELPAGERLRVREAALKNPRLRLCFRSENAAVFEVQ